MRSTDITCTYDWNHYAAPLTPTDGHSCTNPAVNNGCEHFGVGRSGTGSGSVSGSGIDCGTTCSVTLEAGVTATLSATPAADSLFTGWSGAGCAGTDACAVTLNDDAYVTALFDRKRFTLSAARAGTGTGRVSGNGIDCGSNCSTTLDIGTPVSLAATPDAGMVFSGWSGACTGSGGCSFTLDANAAVTATFAPAPAPASRRTSSRRP